MTKKKQAEEAMWRLSRLEKSTLSTIGELAKIHSEIKDAYSSELDEWGEYNLKMAGEYLTEAFERLADSTRSLHEAWSSLAEDVFRSDHDIWPKL